MHSNKRINDGPWVILIILACIIMIATAVAIVAIIMLWKRYVKQRHLFEQSLVGIQYEMPKNLSKEYEVQSLDMFVPTEDRDDLGEVHIGFSPNQGINSIHRVKEVPVSPSQTGNGSVNGSLNYIDRLLFYYFMKLLRN